MSKLLEYLETCLKSYDEGWTEGIRAMHEGDAGSCDLEALPPETVKSQYHAGYYDACRGANHWITGETV